MTNSGEHILVVESDPDVSDLIARQALQPMGYQVTVVDQAAAALQHAVQTPPDLILANLNLPGLNAKDLLVALASQGIDAPLIVIAEPGQEQDILQAFRVGAIDYLHWPARDAEVLASVERALRQTQDARNSRRLEQQVKSVNDELKRKVSELTTILSIGKAVVSVTDQRVLFSRIVDGAVKVTEADMGWLLLRDESSKSYLLTAHHSLPESWAKKFNQPLDDGISSLVVLSGETLLIFGKALDKFKISALGRSAAVVPIKVQKEVIGLLLVVRKQEKPFGQVEQMLLEGVADFASISLVNARLFRALGQAAESARAGEKRQNALLQSVRRIVQDELRNASYPIEFLLSGKSGQLTKDQLDALKSADDALKRLARAAESTLTVPSSSKK